MRAKIYRSGLMDCIGDTLLCGRQFCPSMLLATNTHETQAVEIDLNLSPPREMLFGTVK